MSRASSAEPAEAGVAYEFNIDLDASVQAANLAWLGPHMRSI